MKNMLQGFVVAAALAASSVAVPAVAGQGDYTLIVAPARYSVVQMAFDLIKKRPAVLVSYRGEANTAEPLLYVWDDSESKKEWISISMQDYRDIRFVADTPSRVVLLGDDATLPVALKNATGWAKNIQTVKTLDNAALVNEFGRLWKWSEPEWAWFSKRYNLQLQDEAAPYRRSSWYDQPGPLKRDGMFNSSKSSAPPAFTPSKDAPATAPVQDAAPAVQIDLPPVRIDDAPPQALNAKNPPGTLPTK